MFTRSLFVSSTIARRILFAHASTSTSKFKVALCLQRYPSLSPPMTQLEKDYAELTNKLETENSYLSDHELRHKREQELSKQKQNAPTSAAASVNLVETAIDLEDRLAKEFRNFQFMSRETEDDKTNNLRSHHRKLDENLLLIVKRKDSNEWIFPEKVYEGEKSLRHAVEQLVPSIGNVHVQISGNAPWACYKSGEEKIFFYKGEILAGNVKNLSGASKSSSSSSVYADHAWIGHRDLEKYLSPAYYQAVQDMLFVF